MSVLARLRRQPRYNIRVRRTIEILAFEGCPNSHAADELVTRVVREAGAEADVRRVPVESPHDAERLRFLGSPTIRVDGRDVEPGADAREEYVFACRVYRTASGPAGVPDEAWLRAALAAPAE